MLVMFVSIHQLHSGRHSSWGSDSYLQELFPSPPGVYDGMYRWWYGHTSPPPAHSSILHVGNLFPVPHTGTLSSLSLSGLSLPIRPHYKFLLEPFPAQTVSDNQDPLSCQVAVC